MQALKYLLLYRERFEKKAAGASASATDHFDTLTEDEARMVLSYMESGLILWDFVSPTTAPLGNNADVANVIFTDGCFAWDGLLMFWISQYRIALPEEFLQHAITRKTVDIEGLADRKHKLMADFRNALPVMML